MSDRKRARSQATGYPRLAGPSRRGPGGAQPSAEPGQREPAPTRPSAGRYSAPAIVEEIDVFDFMAAATSAAQPLGANSTNQGKEP